MLSALGSKSAPRSKTSTPRVYSLTGAATPSSACVTRKRSRREMLQERTNPGLDNTFSRQSFTSCSGKELPFSSCSLLCKELTSLPQLWRVQSLFPPLPAAAQEPSGQSAEDHAGAAR